MSRGGWRVQGLRGCRRRRLARILASPWERGHSPWTGPACMQGDVLRCRMGQAPKKWTRSCAHWRPWELRLCLLHQWAEGPRHAEGTPRLAGSRVRGLLSLHADSARRREMPGSPLTDFQMWEVSVAWLSRWAQCTRDKLKNCVCARVCVCVCMLVCMCVCLCTYVYVCMCLHVCLLVCTHVYVCACVYACVHMCMCLHVCMLVYTCKCMHMCTCVHACVCVHVCMCVCVCAHASLHQVPSPCENEHSHAAQTRSPAHPSDTSSHSARGDHREGCPQGDTCVADPRGPLAPVQPRPWPP